MDDRLAIEPEVAALFGLGLEALGILDIVVDAIEDDLAGLASTEQCLGQRGQDGRPVGCVHGMELGHEVVVAHHEDR